MCCCRPRPGARRTAPSPIRSAASRASAPSCRCRAKPSPTGGSSPRSRAAWASPKRSPIARRPTCFASMPRCRRSRTTARAISTSAVSRRSPMRDYDALAPVQWPVPRRRRTPGRAALLRRGRLLHPDRKAPLRRARAAAPCSEPTSSEAFPLRLNTGRIRDQWHTMTRTGMSPRLATHLPEPFVEVHPDDAAAARRSSTAASRASPPRTAPAS